MPGRVAFVPPRYGPEIVGGSEALTREIALGLAGRSWEVEVLTSRVVDHQSMADELPEGASSEDGVTVRRFSTVHHWSKPGRRAQLQIQEGVLPALDDQWTWVSWRFSMPDLYRELRSRGDRFDAVVFSPYMFWNTTVGIGAVPANAVVMPCLHDETYARLAVMRPVLSDPVSVWFLTEPEHRLAHRLGPVASHHSVTGAGLHVPTSYDPAGFVRRHGLTRPFILYAGRREADKGWGWLVETYEAAGRAGLEGIDLVTFGIGDVGPAPRGPGRVIDLGFVDETDRNDAFAAALAYVQPSRMESFSRTVMEAWLAGTPVLAIEGSEVVSWHCRRSGGGWTFADGRQLADALRRLESDPAEAAAMAAKGRDYVVSEYTWPVVLDRIEADLDHVRDVRARAAGRRVVEAIARDDPLPPEPGGAGGILVVGSYPPVPVPGAEVTATEADRAGAGGARVVVVSPRLGASDLAVPVHGLLAGRRLANVARVTGTDRLVLVAERGFPLHGTNALMTLQAVLLRRALSGFDHVRLVRVADPGWPPKVAAMILAAVDESETAAPGRATPGVSVTGPPEVTWRDRGRSVVGRLTDRALGSKAPALRSRLARVRHLASGAGRRRHAGGH